MKKPWSEMSVEEKNNFIKDEIHRAKSEKGYTIPFDFESLPEEDKHAYIDSLSDEEIFQFKRDRMVGYYSGIEPRSKFGSKVITWIISIIAIAVIYGIVNLVIVGVQELMHNNYDSKMDVIESQLNKMNNRLDNYERRINNGTITDGEYDDYKDMIAEYNEKVKEYNSLAEKAGTTYYIVPGLGKK